MADVVKLLPWWMWRIMDEWNGKPRNAVVVGSRGRTFNFHHHSYVVQEQKHYTSSQPEVA